MFRYIWMRDSDAWDCNVVCAGAGSGLRHGREGRRLLAREELVGPHVGRPRLHQDGAQQGQPLRHRVQRLLPARLEPVFLTQQNIQSVASLCVQA